MNRLCWIICSTMAVLLAGCTSDTVIEGPVEPIVEEKSDDEVIDSKNDPFTPGIKVTDLMLPKQNSRVRSGAITHVMLHFTNNALRNPENPYDLDEVYALFEEYQVSAHYMIGRDGEVFHLVPENRAAYHAGKGIDLNYQHYHNSFNDHSIGIELLAIGTKEEMLPIVPEEIFDRINPNDIGYTDAQYKALDKLLEDILKRHPTIKKDREHIVGHDEYAPVRKVDPGSLFDWSKIGF
ncbi:N-acetyl-anhydromuramyl-L-alanine amidase AmpD [Bacillus tianshenii]|uniref:N-acetylmuramoyl-L-alanine amidase n=1 Tax=Sutcliffiella tianshenii TaxID=1463404 RepID=A0ABS2P624_9BACI|nr:N-acetylmuramoyl-L-alanine amidase [Bacillus tianshenii]MBM7622421.1 N-acetyl-anhydromuramyl-L-alanine amidase AmpD [Bacillus tianshenii]